tara:strand:- start:3988 stop:5697 length:1710 start_codon:yes stop_codon:yes gene_type:complete
MKRRLNIVFIVFLLFGLITIVGAGLPEFSKGIVYTQPSYYHSNFDQLDMVVLEDDFEEFSSRFDVVGIWIDWGDIMTSWDSQTKTATYNGMFEEKLQNIVDLADFYGLSVIFNIKSSTFSVPEGIQDTKWINSFVDEGGIMHPGYLGHSWDILTDENKKEAYLVFHEELGRIMKDKPNILYYKHAFESLYIKFPWGRDTPKNVEMWQKFLQDKNPDLSYWNTRWDENYADWESVELVASDHSSWDGYWNQKGEEPYKSSKEKWGDYYRFLLLGIHKDGDYGLSLSEIEDALQKYDTDAILAFKNFKPSRFKWESDLTDAELADIFSFGSVIPLGYYPKDSTDIGGQGLIDYINDVKALTSKPIIIWESGVSTYEFTEEEQKTWIENLDAISKQEGLIGYNIWMHQDSYPKIGVSQGKEDLFGLKDEGGNPKPAWNVLPLIKPTITKPEEEPEEEAAEETQEEVNETEAAEEETAEEEETEEDEPAEEPPEEETEPEITPLEEILPPGEGYFESGPGREGEREEKGRESEREVPKVKSILLNPGLWLVIFLLIVAILLFRRVLKTSEKPY